MTGVIHLPREVIVVGAAVAALATASTLAVAAGSGAFADHRTASRTCVVPALPGSTVSVALVDMRAMMGRPGSSGGGGMMNGRGPLMGQQDWPRIRHGMMRVSETPTSVANGTVSLEVHNTGYLTHELVVLPLAEGQAIGSRIPAADGKVAETGSVGEASASCAPGTGEGIAAGSTGWDTLHLAPGRYELVRNLPGHYAAGMYTELDVT